MNDEDRERQPFVTVYLEEWTPPEKCEEYKKWLTELVARRVLYTEPLREKVRVK